MIVFVGTSGRPSKKKSKKSPNPSTGSSITNPMVSTVTYKGSSLDY